MQIFGHMIDALIRIRGIIASSRLASASGASGMTVLTGESCKRLYYGRRECNRFRLGRRQDRTFGLKPLSQIPLCLQIEDDLTRRGATLAGGPHAIARTAHPSVAIDGPLPGMANGVWQMAYGKWRMANGV